MDPAFLVSMLIMGVFSWHVLGLLVLFQHHLIAAASGSIVVESVHPFMTTLDPSPDGCFQQDNAPCHEPHHQNTSNWFLEHVNELTILQ